MSDAARASREFGEGPLSRVTALIYTLLVVEFLLLVTTAPGLVPLILLDPDASNIPLALACALPLGPALSAALYALRHRRPDITELKPAPAFWRGYRMNAAGVLWIWIPGLAWLAIVAVGLTNLSAADVPVWWGVLLAAVGVAAVLWLANALVITSLFAFRARDIARLAGYFLMRTGRVTLGNAGVLIIAAGVMVLSSELVLALLGSVLAMILLRTSRPMIAIVTKEFTR